MLQPQRKRFWMRSLLIGLVVLTAIGTTSFVAWKQHGAHAASTTTSTGNIGPNQSFTVTNGDTYTFTNNTPGAHAGGKVVFGSWTVVDTTTNTNLGSISGSLDADSIFSPLNIGARLSLTAPLLAPNGTTTFTTAFPDDFLPSGSVLLGSEGVFGEQLLQTCAQKGCPTEIYANQTENPKFPGTSLTQVQPNGPAYQAVQLGIALEQEGMTTLEGITGSTLPAQANHGGGPLAISRAQRAAIFPVTIFAIGIAIGVAGLVASSVCGFTTCSSDVQAALSLVGGLMALTGGIVIGASGYNPFAAANAAAAAAQLAAGLELVTAAVEEGNAMNSAEFAEINARLDALFAAHMVVSAA